MGILDEIDRIEAEHTRAIQASKGAGEPRELWGRYEEAQTAVRSLRKQVQGEILRVEAELEAFRAEKAEAERAQQERAARLEEFIEKVQASVPPPPTPEEEERALQTVGSLLAPCEECGLSKITGVEDEECHCCGGCLQLREALATVLRPSEALTNPVCGLCLSNREPGTVWCQTCRSHTGTRMEPQSFVAARRLLQSTDPRRWMPYEVQRRLHELGVAVEVSRFPEFARGRRFGKRFTMRADGTKVSYQIHYRTPWGPDGLLSGTAEYARDAIDALVEEFTSPMDRAGVTP